MADVENNMASAAPTDHQHSDSGSRRLRMRFWGWGAEHIGLTDGEMENLRKAIGKRAHSDFQEISEPQLDEFSLSTPAVQPPSTITALFSATAYDRLSHCLGKSQPDLIRMLMRKPGIVPDWVAFPRSEADVGRILEWADDTNQIVVPFGAGSSVCGGVETVAGTACAGVISLDCQYLCRVLEIDSQSRAAHIQAGALGPELEEQLRPHGLTLRHFPQSFEYSTLGGWIATRSGGHYASLYTHIDDFVQALSVYTPTGSFQTRRLPGSGAGPSPDRLFIGSEGTLGVITSAWMRLQQRPTFRASASVKFSGMLEAAEAVRLIAQAGLFPANCRVLDPEEAANNRVADDGSAVLILGFESADHPLQAWMTRALEITSSCGGKHDAEAVQRSLTQANAPTASKAPQRPGEAQAWRNAFLRMPFMINHSLRLGLLADTFETAITWDAFPDFYANVRTKMKAVLREISGEEQVRLSCRFTHVYPDGPAPYFSYSIAGGKSLADMMARWYQVKQAANEVLIDCGGTITHHHAVGRDHLGGYRRQIPDAFRHVLRNAKQALDPNSILNPGILVTPENRPLPEQDLSRLAKV